MRYWKYYLRILIPLFGIMAATTIILIIVSCLPGIISRAIGRFTFAKQVLDIEESGRNNKNLMRRIEWIRLYPLKKLILFLLWLFCLFISVTASYVYFFAFRMYDSEDVAYIALFYILTAATFFPVMKYIVRSYHCMPYLNKILPEKEIDSLMEREKFQQVLFSEEYLDTYVPIYKSADWLVVRGTVISRKLTVMAHMNYGYSSDKRHPHTWLEIYYVNGKKIKIDLGRELTLIWESAIVRQGQNCWKILFLRKRYVWRALEMERGIKSW